MKEVVSIDFQELVLAAFKSRIVSLAWMAFNTNSKVHGGGFLML
jgi:hypothetical protein